MSTARSPLLRTAAAAAVFVALAGCANDEPDYYESMREIDAWSDASDEELDELAVSACRLISAAVDAGENNEQAVDRVFSTALDFGLSEPEALMTAITVVGSNCPIDISE